MSYGLRRLIVFCLILILPLCPVTAEELSPDGLFPTANSGMYSNDVIAANDYPQSYLSPCSQAGRVERVRYKVDSEESSEVKRVMVYLPAGYDESDTPYNILYLLHSSGGSVENYFSTDKVTDFQCLIDNMIASGDIEPMIIVAASYEPSGSRINWLPLSMQVPYTASFPDELTEFIIPAVENTYRTYAQNTDEAGIRASRDHRGIAGFSLGGTAVWYTLLQKMYAVRWFLPISEASWDDGEGGINGIWDSDLSARTIYDAIMDQGYGRGDFHLFVATGTDDSAFEVTTEQMKSLLEYSDIFITGTNTNCIMMIDGLHLFSALYTYMYHILPILFTD